MLRSQKLSRSETMRTVSSMDVETTNPIHRFISHTVYQ